MPPGNSNNKPSVVERCSRCGSSSCSGESNHIDRRFEIINYTQAPTFRTDLPRRDNASYEVLGYRTTVRSGSKTPAAPKPAVSPSSLSQSSGSVLPNEEVASTTSSALVRSDVSNRSVLSRNQASNSSSLEVKPSTTIRRTSICRNVPGELRNQSSSSNTRVTFGRDGSEDNIGSTIPAGVNTKSYVPKPPVVRSNFLSTTSGNGELKETSSDKTSFDIDPKPSELKDVGSSSSHAPNKGSLVTSSRLGFTSVSGHNTVLPDPKPPIIHEKSNQLSGSDTVRASNNVSNISNPKLLCDKISDVKQEGNSCIELSKLELDGHVGRKSTMAIQSEKESQHSKGNNEDLLKNHSKKACILEGVVVNFTGSRFAEVRVKDPDGGFKFAQLLVEKFSLHRHAPACTATVDIKSVLRLGEVIKLVCTEHNRKGSSFHYFAHQAWKMEDDASVNNNWFNNDAESVNSFASYGSLHDSEKQQSRSASRNRRRRNRDTKDKTPKALGVDISQWLDNSSQMSSNIFQSGAIIEGFEYSGKVAKLRLPFAFLVEVDLNRGSQLIFVYSKYFYPEGPNSSSMTQGLSIKGLVNIGDQMIVIPIRSNQQKTTDCEWVAKKAWPKGRESSTFKVNKSISEKVPKDDVEPFQSKNSDFMWIKSDHNGAILLLQKDWGLVRELQNDRAFVFTRQNSYLYGLCLKNFVLEDVLQEGDMVKFSRQEGDREEMNASSLCYGCQLPLFNSFVEAIHDYCEEKNIDVSVETELTQLGELMFSFK